MSSAFHPALVRPYAACLWSGALVVAVSAFFCASACKAATVTIEAVGSDGRPLVDAVALIEPLGAKPALKPTPDAQISQSKRQFQPRVTVVTAGTPVTFPNFDTVRHHVYSFSAAKTFELKLYAGVPNAPVVFDKPGIAVLGCNIHDNMAAWVVVSDTPWFARSGNDGKARVENVPAGSYQLRVWHPGLAVNAEPVSSALTIANADVTQTIKLAVSAAP